MGQRTIHNRNDHLGQDKKSLQVGAADVKATLAVSLALLFAPLSAVSATGAREVPVASSETAPYVLPLSELRPADRTSSDKINIAVPLYDVSVVEVRGVPTWITVPWLVPPSNQMSSGAAIADIELIRSLVALGADVRVLALYDELRLYYLIHGSPFLSERELCGVGDVIWQSGQDYLVSVEGPSRHRLGILRSEVMLLRPFEASLASLAPVSSRPASSPIWSPNESLWIERMVNSVSEDDLFDCMCLLTGELPLNLSSGPHTVVTRYAYHPDCLKAAEYLYSQFDSMGVDVAYDHLFAVPFRCVEFLGSEGYAVGNSGRICHTEDGGDTWERQISGTDLPLWRSSFVSPDTGWVVGAAGILLKTTNGGSDWMPLNPGSMASLYGVDFLDADLGWIAGVAGNIKKTTDGGLTWTVQSSGSTQLLYDIDFVDALNGWVVGSLGTILHTSDGGETWRSQLGGEDSRLYDVHFVDSHVGWIVGSTGTILHTVDGGASWHPQESHTTSYLHSVCFLDSLQGWAAGVGGVLLSTEDGGVNWHVQHVAVGVDFNSVSFISDSQGWLAGASTLLRTVDGGASWFSLEENVPDTWKNVVATLEGTTSPSRVYIVCAHYDSFSDRPMICAPGADDNASGTSLVLEAAKILKEYAFESTIRFICFSGEETGLMGSKNYADNAYLCGEQIEAVLNFDMIGWGTPTVSVIGNTSSSWLVDHCVAVGDSFVRDLPIAATIDDTWWRGDHWHFWQKGFDGYMGTELDGFDNRAYHTMHDVVDRLDVHFVGNVTRLAVASLASLAELDTTGTAVASIEIKPNTLNLKSKGKYVTCRIELPPEHSAADVDVSSVMLNSIVKAESAPSTAGDYEGDRVSDLVVKFSRESVENVIQIGDAMEIAVSGKVGSSLFYGRDTIRVAGEKEHPVQGTETVFAAPEMPHRYGLFQNYPNPFNPECRIRFDIPHAEPVILKIFDVEGSIVRTLVEGWRAAGTYTELWDGKAEDGSELGSGVYFYRLEAGDFVATRKTVLLR